MFRIFTRFVTRHALAERSNRSARRPSEGDQVRSHGRCRYCAGPKRVGVVGYVAHFAVAKFIVHPAGANLWHLGAVSRTHPVLAIGAVAKPVEAKDHRLRGSTSRASQCAIACSPVSPIGPTHPQLLQTIAQPGRVLVGMVTRSTCESSSLHQGQGFMLPSYGPAGDLWNRRFVNCHPRHHQKSLAIRNSGR